MVQLLPKFITSVIRVATVAGLCAAVSACVVPPQAHYGGAYPAYALAGVIVQPRPVYAPPQQFYVQPRPAFTPQPIHAPVISSPVSGPRSHEGGWGWNTTQRERMERRLDTPRRVF
jgi:hypothetical protein